MQFSVGFVATALLASACPVLSAVLTSFAGAGCTGAITAVDNSATPPGCFFLVNGGSAKSMSYSGVPNEIQFFESGGAHDMCTNGPTLVLGGGSGCGTAPDGFNFESVFIS